MTRDFDFTSTSVIIGNHTIAFFIGAYMSLEKLNFICRPGPTTTTKYSLLESTMGDGYVERKDQGINNDLKSYKLTYVIPDDACELMRTFLDSKKGRIPFLLMSPFRKDWTQVVCQTYTETTHHFYSEFQLTVVEDITIV